MSIFRTRNWTDEIRRQEALSKEANRRQEAYAQSQLTAFRQALWGAEFDREAAKTEQWLKDNEQSQIAKDAEQGTIIDGVVVRKPQPRLT